MRFGCRQELALAVVLGAGWLLVAGAARAQPTLSPQTLQAQGTLTPEQRQEVDAYVDQVAPGLISGDPAAIRPSRAALLSPAGGAQPTDVFRQYYSESVSRRLAAGLADDQSLLTRLNAMRVIAELQQRTPQIGDAAFENILRGLEDPSPGVRYWAMSAVLNAASVQDNPQLDGQRRQRLVDALTGGLADETDNEVIRQMLLALVEVGAYAEANEAFFNLLERNVGQPTRPFRAVREGMESLYRTLVTARAEGRDVAKPMGELALAASRYLVLLARQAPDVPADRMTDRLEADYISMMMTAERILDTAHSDLSAQVQRPAGLNPIDPDWERVLEVAEQWQDVLAGPPFNVPPDRLEVPAPPDNDRPAQNVDAVGEPSNP